MLTHDTMWDAVSNFHILRLFETREGSFPSIFLDMMARQTWQLHTGLAC